ncbi:SIS domain-containing protein [Candidatus Altiarchaeota archaeon]
MRTDSSNKVREYLDGLKTVLDDIDVEGIDKLISVLVQAYENEKQVFMFGNGGSGSTASHLACDLNKGCCHGLKKRFKVMCLNDSIPTILAYANDVGYDAVFIEQLKNFMKADDVVIGFSGSGNSQNVINAIEHARKNGAYTIGLSGYDGGKLAKNVDLSIHVAVDDMQKAEDAHFIICHIIMQAIFTELNPK